MNKKTSRCLRFFTLTIVLLTSCAPVSTEKVSTNQKSLLAEAHEALARATAYFHLEISTRGSYLWSYSADLKDRRGDEDRYG